MIELEDFLYIKKCIKCQVQISYYNNNKVVTVKNIQLKNKYLLIIIMLYIFITISEHLKFNWCCVTITIFLTKKEKIRQEYK